jgi:hypothetical protein
MDQLQFFKADGIAAIFLALEETLTGRQEKNLNPNMVIAAHIIVLGSWETPGCDPIGLGYVTRPEGQNIVVQHRVIFWMSTAFYFFCRLRMNFLRGTSPIRITISLCFQRVQEHHNWVSYAIWASVLRWTAPGF